jgi:NDP-sugar pyrophosphorylase family protein
LRVSYSLEKEPLGRGGALKQGWSRVPRDEETVVACNGDILTNQPLRELVAFHTDRSAAATVMLAPLRSPYGIVDVGDDGRITSFREKPVLPFWINAGIYVLSREFFALLPEKGDHETTTFPQLAAEGRLFGFKSKAYWRPVDSIKDVSEATRELVGQDR